MNGQDKDALLRALIGFIIGALLGAAMSLGGMWLWNWAMEKMGKPLNPIHWWDALPLAIILGLSLAINMAHPPFSD